MRKDPGNPSRPFFHLPIFTITNPRSDGGCRIRADPTAAYSPKPLEESDDCLHVNGMFPFISSSACCGVSSSYLYPDPYVDYNGDFNITCDAVTKRIVEIDMSWNFLETDPCSYTTCPEVTTMEAIGGLTELVNLRFYFTTSRFKSTYPTALGNLGKLKILQLWGSFYGSLPTSIKNMNALEEMYLNSVPIEPFKFSQFISIPTEFGELKNLKRASFVSVSFDELPLSIGDLPKLLSLSVRRSRIRSIPPAISKLQSLVSLYT
ncbi:hypothetical protein BC829DRAFT_92126 [Chytridium lagenaria]|nr:hypothetical protein BC829DRAFT_92126 [Chytridium lagenaria]